MSVALPPWGRPWPLGGGPAVARLFHRVLALVLLCAWLSLGSQVEVLVGTSSASLPCRGTVRLSGSLREVGAGRRLVTPVTVERAGGGR